jgi:hypothetical protein
LGKEAENMIFQNFIYQLEAMGIADVLLPFILVFTVVYAVLNKTKILGDRKQFHVIIALVMGMSVVIPHVVGTPILGFDPVVAINTALPQVSIIVIAILMVLVIVGVFGNEWDIGGTSPAGWVVILAFISVALIFGSAVNLFSMPDWLYFLEDPKIQSLIVMILVFGIIIYFVTKEDKDPNKRSLASVLGDTVKSRTPSKK